MFINPQFRSTWIFTVTLILGALSATAQTTQSENAVDKFQAIVEKNTSVTETKVMRLATAFLEYYSEKAVKKFNEQRFKQAPSSESSSVPGASEGESFKMVSIPVDRPLPSLPETKQKMAELCISINYVIEQSERESRQVLKGELRTIGIMFSELRDLEAQETERFYEDLLVTMPVAESSKILAISDSLPVMEMRSTVDYVAVTEQGGQVALERYKLLCQ